MKPFEISHSEAAVLFGVMFGQAQTEAQFRQGIFDIEMNYRKNGLDPASARIQAHAVGDMYRDVLARLAKYLGPEATQKATAYLQRLAQP
jgi:hypothetical protein